MIRKFHLENSKGQKFNFKYSTGVLLTDVQGLGFALELSYLKYNHIHKTVKKDSPLAEISGVLVFIDGYEGYQKFIDYLNQDTQQLKLYYQSYETKYAYVDIFSVSKSEIEDGVLKSSISFNRKSYWIKERQIVIDNQETTGGKQYPFVYPYIYQQTQQGFTQVTIGGCEKASSIIEIDGSIDRPEINVIQSGKIVSRFKINLTKENIKLIISSVPDNQFMHMIENETILDIYSYQDFEKENFLLLNPGLLTIEFKPGVMTPTFCKIAINEYHLG